MTSNSMISFPMQCRSRPMAGTRFWTTGCITVPRSSRTISRTTQIRIFICWISWKAYGTSPISACEISGDIRG
nr:MAG TPA: hypothetical protein [Caudoviricetes sp.]